MCSIAFLFQKKYIFYYFKFLLLFIFHRISQEKEESPSLKNKKLVRSARKKAKEILKEATKKSVNEVKSNLFKTPIKKKNKEEIDFEEEHIEIETVTVLNDCTNVNGDNMSHLTKTNNAESDNMSHLTKTNNTEIDNISHLTKTNNRDNDNMENLSKTNKTASDKMSILCKTSDNNNTSWTEEEDRVLIQALKDFRSFDSFLKGVSEKLPFKTPPQVRLLKTLNPIQKF